MGSLNILFEIPIGKYGQTVGQRRHRIRYKRRWVNTPNTNDPDQVLQRNLFKQATDLAKEAMLFNGGAPEWQVLRLNEWTSRVGQALRHLHNGEPPESAIPYYPDNFNAHYPFDFSFVEFDFDTNTLISRVTCPKGRIDSWLVYDIDLEYTFGTYIANLSGNRRLYTQSFLVRNINPAATPMYDIQASGSATFYTDDTETTILKEITMPVTIFRVPL